MADYMVETAHLTNEQDLAYRRLLDLYYTQERALVNDVQALARRIRCSVESCQQVLVEYFRLDEAGFQHARCNEEIAKYHAKSSRNRSNIEKRWLKKSTETIPVVYDRNTTVIPSNNDGIRLGYQTKSTESTTSTSTNINIISTTSENTPPAKRPVVEKPSDVSDQTWADFLTHRRNRRAPLTPTAWKSIQSEAQKARKGLETVLETMISRGWTGYKAEWDIVDSRPQNGRYGAKIPANTHIPNMPLGAQGCSCAECVAHRDKQKKPSANYNPNL